MAKQKVGPTEQDTHPPRTDMEKFEAIRKIMYRGLTPNSWCLDHIVLQFDKLILIEIL